MKRAALQLAGLLILSWCVMTITHEAGHILGGWCSGAVLRDADLRPWRLPYSLFEPNPHPLVTLWGGPLIGVIVPALAAVLVRRNWMWFIAFFCVLANGAYLAAGWASRDPFLDTQQLLEHGASRVAIGLYCLLTVGVGYAGLRSALRRIVSPSLGPASREPNSDDPDSRIGIPLQDDSL